MFSFWTSSFALFLKKYVREMKNTQKTFQNGQAPISSS